MLDPSGNRQFDIPDYENTDDEAFPPLPPPHSPSQMDGEGGIFANGEDEGEVSKLAEAPVAKRRSVKRPQPKLDSQRLISERGLPALRTLFDNVKFKGKGHEAEDLRQLMQKMENWAHRLYPKLQFEDFIDKLESLGSKKEVQTCLKRIRLDMPLTHEDFVGKDGEEEEGTPREEGMPVEPDPFGESSFVEEPPLHSTPAMVCLTEDQWRRIELNKQLAQERRLARLRGNPDASQPGAAAGEPSSSSTYALSQGSGESEQGLTDVPNGLPQDSLLDDEGPGMSNGSD